MADDPKHSAVVAAGNEMESLIIKAQGILANRLKPDGISAADTIDQLLGLLDGPEQRAAQQAWTLAKA